MLAIALFLSAVLSACSSPSTPAVTPAKIAAVEVAVTELERSALAYTKLPVCPVPAVQPCSQAATRAIVISDAHKAHDAFLTLQRVATPANLEAAQAAIAVLTTDIPAKP